MYTEEKEFDYNDYIDDSDKSKKPFIDFKFILKVILIILLIILIIFLVFKIANSNKQKNNKSNNDYKDSELVFVDNFNLLKDATRSYFFDKKYLPKEVSNSTSCNVKNLMAENLITSLKDEKGNICNYNESGATLTKNKNDYKMDVKLVCGVKISEKTYYYDLEGKCLTCNGESYVPSIDDEIIDDDENIPDRDDDFPDDHDKVPVDNDDDEIPTPTPACDQRYSDWTSVYKESDNLDRETRVLVKGYKEIVTYGEWSSPTTTKITGNENLEVKVFDKEESSTSKKCSSESTTKPSSKSGRTISTRKETVKSTKKVCTEGYTYTKTLTKWDNDAYSCKSYGIGKVECTYKVAGSCTNKTVYNTITYYRYCDTVTNKVTKTYYQSRVIKRNTVYTDYMLESELPSDYTKVNGSEKVEYRYRQKCVK